MLVLIVTSPENRYMKEIALNSRMGITRGGNGLTRDPEGRGNEEETRMRREQSGERATLPKKTSSKRAGDNTGIQLLTSVNASSRARISPHPPSCHVHFRRNYHELGTRNMY